MLKESFRGYLITEQIDGMFAVSKNGFHIAVFASVVSAKQTIDMLLS